MILCRNCEAEGARVRQVFGPDELAFLNGAAVAQMRTVARMTPEQKKAMPQGTLSGAMSAIYKLLLATPPQLRQNVIGAFRTIAQTDIVLDQCTDDADAVVH